MNRHARTSLLGRGRLRKHIEHQLIVDLDEGDLHGDLIVEKAADLREDFVDGARDQTTILVVGRAATHSEGLTSASLTVAHNRAVEAVDDFMDGLLRAVFKNFLLRSVMQEFVKFECPLLLLVVNDTPLLVFGNRDRHSLWKRTVRMEQ